VAESLNTQPHRHLRLVLDEQERERSDLAHRLHDQLAQSLAAVLLGLDGLGRHVSAEEAGRLASLREQLADALSLCTELAIGLRPAVLDELGLVPALESLAARAGADRVRVDAGLAAARLEPDLETEVYRTVEEALAAMGASCALTMTLDTAANALLLSIQASDDTDEVGDLARIEARTELIGATLDTGSHARTIRIRIPAPTGIRLGFSATETGGDPRWRVPPTSVASRHDDFT
jgi:signal transduction histidine kinase